MIFVNYPGHLVAALLLIGFAGLTALVFRSSELQKVKLKLYRPLIVLLQYGAIVILLLILWNPSCPKVTETVSRNSALALFDTSESMSVAEDGRTSRLDKALKIFEQKFRPSDSKGPDYKFILAIRMDQIIKSSDLTVRPITVARRISCDAGARKQICTVSLHCWANMT